MSSITCITLPSGEQHYLWRAVDQEGNVLDILVQKLLKGMTKIIDYTQIYPFLTTISSFTLHFVIR